MKIARRSLKKWKHRRFWWFRFVVSSSEYLVRCWGTTKGEQIEGALRQGLRAVLIASMLVEVHHALLTDVRNFVLLLGTYCICLKV